VDEQHTALGIELLTLGSWHGQGPEQTSAIPRDEENP